MMLHLRWVPKIFLLLLDEIISNDFIRLNLTRRAFLWNGRCSLALTVPVEVDGQGLNLLVDTGAPQTFVISNDTLYNGKACNGSIYGLYECHLPGLCNKLEEVEFRDGRKTDIVDHRADLKLGDYTVLDVQLGIVKNYTAPGLSPHSSLGLGPVASSRGFVPLLDQLVTKGIIKTKEFSIYFHPENRNEGELLLGGSDPRKHCEKLAPVPVRDDYEWIVTLDDIRIAGTPVLEAPYPILFDTGTAFLAAPLEVLDTIIRHIEKSVRHGSGHEMVWHWIEGVPYLHDCNDLAYFPTIELVLTGLPDGDNVRLLVPPDLYIAKTPNTGTCIILFLRIPADHETVIVGITLLRDYYINFNVDKRQISIAKTAEVSQAKHSLRPLMNKKRSPPALSLYPYDNLSGIQF